MKRILCLAVASCLLSAPALALAGEEGKPAESKTAKGKGKPSDKKTGDKKTEDKAPKKEKESGW